MLAYRSVSTLIALDIALLPPADVRARAIDISAALPAAESHGLRLDDEHIPHITLTQQFIRADFRAVVEHALVVSGLAPDRLWIELTESAVVEAIDSAARAFQALREQGVRIAIDDFGTGFSSFSHLRDFRVDLVKVDRSFVRDLGASHHDRAIVEGIVRMAEALRLDVVAEGIETTDQRDLLRVFGCRYGQGFLYARPSPIAVPQLAPLIPGPRTQAVEQEAPH